MQVDADVRLAAAVGGVARYLADAAGLENDAVSQLQSCIVAACQEAFEHLTGDHPHLDVTAACFADRIEIALSHQGESSPAVGLNKIAGFAAHIGGGAGVFVGVDQVQYESHDGEAVTRLTKYIGEIGSRV
jgi:hypothetical protein